MIIKGIIAKTVKDKLIIIDENGRVLVAPEHIPMHIIEFPLVYIEGYKINVHCYYNYENKGYYAIYYNNEVLTTLNDDLEWNSCTHAQQIINEEEYESLKRNLINLSTLFPADKNTGSDTNFGKEVRKLINKLKDENNENKS